jgi:phosphate transport system permease protein
VADAEMTQKVAARLAKRHRAEKRFQFYGKAAVSLAIVILCFLLYNLIVPGMSGLQRTEIAVTVSLPKHITTPKHLRRNAYLLVKQSFRDVFPDVVDKADKKALTALLSSMASRDVIDAWKDDASLVVRSHTIWLMASDEVDMFFKGRGTAREPEESRPLSNRQIGWLQTLDDAGKVRTVFNWDFFRGGDSREPEAAGFGGAVIGSLLTMLVCLLASFPVGVMSAVYLEEFSKKGWLRDVIEVNINNLAAVPSIVFGLLGLSVYLNFFGMPRSAPLVGGLTLALMSLPTIIITTRVSLQAVPDAIRQAAMGLGASPLQVVWHHVLPLAMPGIMTGTILGMARAIGETAPLLLIGMVAFIVDVPSSVVDAATVMPVQIYIWASSPEAGFIDKTAAGILVLILLLLMMNAAAIYLRRKYEYKW